MSTLPTAVRSVQPRTPDGKYVSHANDVQVFHPRFTMGQRQPRRSELFHARRNGTAQASSFGKADTEKPKRSAARTGGYVGAGGYAASHLHPTQRAIHGYYGYVGEEQGALNRALSGAERKGLRWGTQTGAHLSRGGKATVVGATLGVGASKIRGRVKKAYSLSDYERDHKKLNRDSRGPRYEGVSGALLATGGGSLASTADFARTTKGRNGLLLGGLGATAGGLGLLGHAYHRMKPYERKNQENTLRLLRND